MWFSICYGRIVLFVCFVSAQIKDSKDIKPPPDLKAVVVRQVNCSTDTDRATQVLLNGRWHPLCNDSNFRNIDNYFCDLVKESFTEKAEMFGNAEPTVNSTFVTLHCMIGQPCTPETEHKCPNGTVRKRCNKERPGSKTEELKYCSYPGSTATNCSGNYQDLWMTYEHTFYHQDLPKAFTAWTSSYLTKTTSCEEISDASCLTIPSNSSTTTSMLDCFNYCIDPNTSEYNLTLAAVGIHTNTCTCYFGDCFQGIQSNRSSSCSEPVYRVTTSSSINRTQMEYCIAVRRNYTNTFTVKHCSTLLPQICGTNICWPHNPCQNGGRCILGNDYLNYTCQCRPDFSGNNCTRDNLCWPQNPCQNGNRCILSNDYLNYTCQCRPDFSGNNCTSHNGFNYCGDGSGCGNWSSIAVFVGILVIVAGGIATFCLIYRQRRTSHLVRDQDKRHHSQRKGYSDIAISVDLDQL